MDSLLIFVLLFKCADSACELFALNERKNISFNQLLTTFNVFPIEYEISFKACLTTFSTGKYEQFNLFDFTTSDSNSWGPNSKRVLGIWFDVNNIMYIYANINGTVQNQIIENFFTTGCKIFKISQLLYQRFYNLNINVDGVNVYTTKNTGAQEFNNVKMYFSDPWYTAQPGYFQNLFVTKGCSEIFSLNGTIEVSQSNLLTTLDVFPIEYEITFEVCFTSFTNDSSYTNLFDFTTGDNDDYNYNTSKRIIGIWFINGKFSFFANFNGLVYNHFISNTLTPGCKKFEISQLKNQGNNVFALKLDGINLYTAIIKDAKEFNNVKLYFSDPWYAAQPGYLNYFFVTKGCSESNLFCKPQLNIQLNYLIVKNILNITLHVSYDKSEELAYNIVWEYFLPPYVTLQSEITVTNASKITANSLKYTISELQINGINQTITANIKNTKCLFGGSYTIDIPFKFYFENYRTTSWNFFRTIREVLKESCKNPVLPINENHVPEYYGRGIYWDEISYQIYLCINQHVAKVQESACYNSKDNGLHWQAMDVRIGAILGHDISSRQLYAIHRNQKLYIMFHNLFNKWLAVTNDDFKLNVIHKLNWIRLKTFVGVLDENATFTTNQWMGNEDGLYFKNLTDNTWIQRFKWNV